MRYLHQRVILLCLVCASCLCQYSPPSGGGSGNATTVNGAVIPADAVVLTSNHARQIIDNGIISTSQAARPIGARPASGFAFTDGSGVTAPGVCAVFTVDLFGNLEAGNDADGNCLMEVGGFYNVITGQTLQASGGGTIRATAVTLVTGSLPSCAAGNRGQFWYVAGGAGVQDSVSVCAKDAANAYAWRTIY